MHNVGSHTTAAPEWSEVFPGALVHVDGANTAVLRHGDAALVINPASRNLVQGLRAIGIRAVEHVFFTHHRRELADGWQGLLSEWSPAVHVPAAEAELFANPATYWANPASRWRVLCDHVPYHVTHIQPIRPDVLHDDGDAVCWYAWCLRVVTTPGYTDGSLTFLAERDGRRVAFTGDLIYAPGKIRDLYSLQHGDARNGHTVGDYHGFMGSMETVIASLRKIGAHKPDSIVPAHGLVMDCPAAAIDLLIARLHAAYRNYSGISALRWYFPKYFEDHNTDSQSLPMQETFPRPDAVRRILDQCWALVADNGHAILIDPCSGDAVDATQALIARGELKVVDAIWITHYHHDHVLVAARARQTFACPIMTDRHLSDVIEQPAAYFLTCLCNAPATVDRVTENGETWNWEQYTLSAYHFPGQSYYHAGLLAVTDTGLRYFFSGDSFTPTGIDDYCSWNRNFLGTHVGYHACLCLLRELAPDLIFNQHVDVGFRFSATAYDRMLANLAEREGILGTLLPYDHPDFGTDEYWVHAYPYEQTVRPGQTVVLYVRVWNHAATAHALRCAVQAPEGWRVDPASLATTCPARQEARLRFALTLPRDAAPGRHVVPINVEFAGENLGSFREAIFDVGMAPTRRS